MSMSFYHCGYHCRFVIVNVKCVSCVIVRANCARLFVCLFVLVATSITPKSKLRKLLLNLAPKRNHLPRDPNPPPSFRRGLYLKESHSSLTSLSEAGPYDNAESAMQAVTFIPQPSESDSGACIYACLMYVCVCMCMCVCMYGCIYYVCVYICMYVCMYVSMYVCV